MRLGNQCQLLRQETGTVSAIAGILKAPFDIIADKLRGYIGLTMDMHTQPDKVLAACEALVPHLAHVACTTADANKQVPVGYWMHRGCVPFVTMKQFHSHYWPTLRPIVEELWKHGHQTLFYAEGKWNAHLGTFAELPDQSIVYHVDQDDIFDVHKKIGHKFCLSGGIPNFLLSFGTPQEVRDCCQKVIDRRSPRRRLHHGRRRDHAERHQNREPAGHDRGHARVRRVFARPRRQRPGHAASSESRLRRPRRRPRRPPGPRDPARRLHALGTETQRTPAPDRRRRPARRVWDSIEGLGNMFIWQVLLSF